jgi:F0F1-type ATP synthase epsilon subunit
MISQTPPPQPPENTLQLVIRTRQDMLYQGRVKAVSSVNDTGPFDVLAHHAYFISVIQKQITIHEIDGTNRQIEITQGIMHVENDVAHVYLDSQA